MTQITKDNAYDAVAPDDFPAMLEVDRYGKRSTAFDKIISATHDHFWDPLDKKYIDFTEPFDTKTNQILPNEFFPIFSTKLGRTILSFGSIAVTSIPKACARRATCVPMPPRPTISIDLPFSSWAGNFFE